MTGVATNSQGSGFSHASTSPKKLVCLYAQEDTRFFRELQRHLHIWVRQQKIVWLEISAGDPIGEAMTSHLRQADLILLLDSADFIAADAAYQWMQMALEEQVQRQIPVVPILARPSAWEETPYGVLKVLPENQQPISLWQDRDEAYRQIFKSLTLLPELHTIKSATPASSAIQPTKKPAVASFQARELTAEYVARPEIVAHLKHSLLQAGSAQTTAITTALQGAGGFGKTTLALAMAHNPEVQQAFPDGVFWVELGEQPPSTLDLFNQLLPLLGDGAAEAGTIEEAQARWKNVLADMTCLLIVDDVWQESALHPLLEGGPGCRRLVTTRNDGVLPQSAHRVIVDAMSEQEAMTMMTQGLAIDLSQAATRVALVELVEHLGCWPLLLSVAHGLLATQLRYGRPLLQALEVIRHTYQGQRGVSIQSSTAMGFRETVERSLTSSFRQLQEVVAAHHQPVKRYGELAIFPEDTDIPIAALRLFWQATGGLQPWETDDLCMQLASLSLVVHCDLEEGTIRLHDVIRDYLIERASSRLPTWQALFLEAVRKGLGIERWAEVSSSNTYLWQHLIWHLCQAKRWEELQSTLTDVSFLARKVWYLGVSALEADLVLAKTATTEYNQNSTSTFFSALHRRMTRLSHLLRQTQSPSEVGSVLLSYLENDPLFAGQGHLLKRDLPRPYLLAWHPLPESAASSSLIRTLHGHTFLVTSCAVSPDGRFIVSASGDRTLKVWEASTGQELHTLSGHMDSVTSCAVSPDSRFIVSASHDHTLKVWEASTGQELRTLSGHTLLVTGCTVSPNGRFIVSASSNFILKVWEASTGQELYTLSGHTAYVTSCAVSPDGRFIVSASDDRTLKVWEASTGRELRTLSGHMDSVTSCAVSPDGRFIVSASHDHTLKVWETSTGQELHTLSGHTDSVTSCAMSSDGRFIASASRDKTLKVWEAATGRELYTLSGHTAWVNGCAVSPDGRFIVSASGDRTLKVWETFPRREPPRPFSGHTAWINDCAVSPDGRFIVSAFDDRALKLWEVSTGQELRTLAGHTDAVISCAISPDNRFIVSTSGDHTLKLWESSTGQELRSLAGHTFLVTSCAVSPDGRFVLSASHDRTLKVWEVSTGRELRTLSGHTETVNGCAVSPDGRFIVSASSDHTLKLWETSTGRELYTLSGHTASVTSCAMSPDGRFIVSASGDILPTSFDHTLKVWEVSTGRELRTLSGHTALVTSCAMSPDGRFIVSASYDKTLKLWELQNGQCLLSFPVDGNLSRCVFHPDGEHLIACGANGLFFLRLVW